ncbi:MAG: hypothetical protein EB101_05655 [Chitinophagia bacterium]|nr:hypothetical protein [Chitinophagia bacterium]
MKQGELNKNMVMEGVLKYRSKTNNAKAKQRETASNAGATLLKGAVADVSGALSKWIVEASSRPGVNHSSVKLLSLFDPDLASFIVCRVILDSISSRKPLTSTAIAIGTALEDEARFAKMSKQDARTWKRIRLECDKKIGFTLKRIVANHRLRQANFEWKWWTPTEKLHLGMACIENFRMATGLIEIEKQFEKRSKNTNYIVASSDTKEWMEKYDKFNELLCPTLMPMVEKPVDWKDAVPYGGGYGDGVFSVRPSLVKTASRLQIKSLEGYSMPVVYEAVNKLQNTKWRVNQKVLEVVEQYWNTGSTANGVLPSSDLLPIPAKPADIGTNQEARKNWKREAAKVYEANAKSKSKRLQTSRTLAVARKLAGCPEIYFPYQIDFRGRVYALPYFLTPQGTDLARGLLTFKDGKALGKSGLVYLKLHGANCFGLDKASLEDRIAWVDAHQEQIKSVGQDPFSAAQFWTQADEPWQFLAWCFEYSTALRVGVSFVSSLPISLDASNNGLQILSLLMRDPEGAEATNCIPTPHPRDIYADVATKVLRKLEQRDDSVAKAWLKFGVTRKTTKRPVMILPYGGTYQACRIYIEEWLMDEVFKRPFPSDIGIFKASLYLTPIVWESIKETVGKAQECMGWLQQMARVCYKSKTTLKWVTPSGFPVVQEYPKTFTKLVKSSLAGQVRYHRLAVDKITLSLRRQVNGVSPNFVHSLDSACLHQTVVDLKDVENFAMIHDSFGVVAADAENMAITLRRVYAKIFQKNVLKEFREKINNNIEGAKQKRSSCVLPPLPNLGTLDVAKLELSNYFFS